MVERATNCVAAFVDVWFHQGEFLVESSPSGPYRFIRSSPRSWGHQHPGTGDFHVAPFCRRCGVDERTTFPGRCTLGKLGGEHWHGQGKAPCHCGDDDHIGGRTAPCFQAVRLCKEQASTFLPGGNWQSPPKCRRQSRSPTSRSLVAAESSSSCARNCGLFGRFHEGFASQHGPLASAPLTAMPMSGHTD